MSHWYQMNPKVLCILKIIFNDIRKPQSKLEFYGYHIFFHFVQIVPIFIVHVKNSVDFKMCFSQSCFEQSYLQRNIYKLTFY